MKRILLYVIAPWFLMGCAGESKKADAIDNEKIYQRYSISYDEENEKTSVQAEFRIGAYWDRMEEEKTGGEAVEFASADAITYNGEPMQKDNSAFTGAYYSLSKKGTYNPTHTWVWTNAKGKKYTNAVTVNPIQPKTIKFYGRDSLRIEWEGGPIEEYEKVTVRFDGSDKNDSNGKKKTANTTITTQGATGMTIGYELIKNLSGIDFELERSVIIRTKEHTPEEGSIKIVYKSKSKSLSTDKPLLSW